MGKGGGGTQTTNTVQKADPWVGVQPFMQDVFTNAKAQFNAPGPTFFPMNTVGPQAAETLQAQGLAAQRAVAGSPIERSAQAENLRTTQGQYLGLSPAQPLWNATMRGDFLNANPYLDSMFARAARPVTQQFTDAALPGVSSMFSQAGRFGSGAQQTAVNNLVDTYGRTIGDMAAGIYGGNYAAERQLQAGAANEADQAFGRERLMQQQAAGQAPGLAATDFANIAQLSNVGADREAFAQRLVNDAVQRWNFAQQTPAQKLAQYNALIQGGLNFQNTAGTNVTDLPPPNRVGNAAGGALLGASLSSSPWGALIGGMLGAFS